jgi:hypothetical protein
LTVGVRNISSGSIHKRHFINTPERSQRCFQPIMPKAPQRREQKDRLTLPN